MKASSTRPTEPSTAHHPKKKRKMAQDCGKDYEKQMENYGTWWEMVENDVRWLLDQRRGGAFRSASRKASLLGFGQHHMGNKQKPGLIMRALNICAIVNEIHVINSFSDLHGYCWIRITNLQFVALDINIPCPYTTHPISPNALTLAEQQQILGDGGRTQFTAPRPPEVYCIRIHSTLP